MSLEALESQESIDCENPWMLESKVALIKAYTEAGRTAEAIEFGEKSLQSCQAAHGAADANTRRLAASLANAYRADGETDRASAAR